MWLVLGAGNPASPPPTLPLPHTHTHKRSQRAISVGWWVVLFINILFFFGGTACLKPYSWFTSNQPSAGKWLIYIFTPFQIILAVCVKLVFKEICYRKCSMIGLQHLKRRLNTIGIFLLLRQRYLEKYLLPF